jgi:hypothetical protein
MAIQVTAKAAYRAPRVPETAVQAHIVQLLRTLGARVYVMGTHRRRGDFHGTMQTEGIPDLMAFLPMRDRIVGDGVTHREIAIAPVKPRQFLFIEAKAQGGRLRPEQKIFRELCLQATVDHVVGGLDAVIAWLVERGYVRADSVPHYRQPEARP